MHFRKLRFSPTFFLETADRRGKKLGLGGRYLVYIGYFLLLSVQDQSEVISFFAGFQQPYILKTAGRRVKRTNIWNSEVGI